MHVNLYVAQDGVYTEDGRRLTPTEHGAAMSPFPTGYSCASPYAAVGENIGSTLYGGSSLEYQQPQQYVEQSWSPEYEADGMNHQNSLRGGGSNNHGQPTIDRDPFGLNDVFEDDAIRGGQSPPNQYNPNVINMDDLGQYQGADGVQVFTIDAEGNLVPMDPSQADQPQAEEQPYDPFGGLSIEINGVPVDLNAAMSQPGPSDQAQGKDLPKSAPQAPQAPLPPPKPTPGKAPTPSGPPGKQVRSPPAPAPPPPAPSKPMGKSGPPRPPAPGAMKSADPASKLKAAPGQPRPKVPDPQRPPQQPRPGGPPPKAA